MTVFSPIGGTGQIIDETVIADQEALKEKTKKGFSILAECYAEKDSGTVLTMLLDATEPARVRVKAAEMIGDIGESKAVESLNNHKFGNQILQNEVDKAGKKFMNDFLLKNARFALK